MAIEPGRALVQVLPSTLDNRPKTHTLIGKTVALPTVVERHARPLADPYAGFEAGAPRGTYLDILV